MLFCSCYWQRPQRFQKKPEKKQVELLLKTSGVVYGTTDVWRKNFIGLSKEKNTLTYINFKDEKPQINHVALQDIKQCNILKSYNNNANAALKNLDLELVSISSKSNVVINFFNLDEDLIQDFELPRIEKWQQLIKDALTDQTANKLAS